MSGVTGATPALACTAKEQRWGWVLEARDEFNRREHEALQGSVASARGAAESARSSVIAVGDATVQAVNDGESWIGRQRTRAFDHVRMTAREYPEWWVGGLTVLSCNARGVANGTMLGAAPRRAALTALVLAAFFQKPLLAKWKGNLGDASKWLSDAMRAPVESAGLLPTPRGAGGGGEAAGTSRS